MKLSQTRLREIIQEEVARMEARGQREPTPRASFFNAVATAARKEIKKLAPTRTQRNNLWDMYKGNWDEAVEQGMEADLAKDVLVQIEQEKRLGLFDRGSLDEVDTAGLETLAALSQDEDLRNTTPVDADAKQLIFDLQAALKQKVRTPEERADLIRQAVEDFKS